MSALAAGIEAAGVTRPENWEELGSSAKDLWEERQVASIVKEGTALGVWMLFDDEDDEEPSHEGNVFFNEDGTYRGEWENTSVGQITDRTFPTFPEAVAWLEDSGYIDMTP
jgi:hypothetical protein